MAITISESKVLHQLFKCYNCGRKSVSLGTDDFKYIMTEKESTVESDVDETELLDDLTEVNDEWMATCSHCGWSDS